MEKRTLLAIAISIAILIVYQYFFLGHTVPPDTGRGIVKESAKGEVKESSALPAALIPKTDVTEEERDVVVDNDLYTATFSSMGGAIKSLLLKHYNDASGKPIVLKSDDVLPPFSIGVDEGFQFAHAPFLVRGSNIKLTPELNTASIAFDFSDKGISIRRTYTFHYGDYAIDLKDEVNGLPSYWITLGKDFGIYDKESSSRVHYGPVVLKDADRLEFSASKLKEPRIIKD